MFLNNVKLSYLWCVFKKFLSSRCLFNLVKNKTLEAAVKVTATARGNKPVLIFQHFIDKNTRSKVTIF